MKKEVQIIIPTYHREIGIIQRAINSVKNQTLSECIEIWVIRDGCEKTCQFCKKIDDYFLGRDDIVYKTADEHYGWYGYGCRNIGLLGSDLPFVGYLDDDNWYKKNHVEVCLNGIKDCDLVYTGSFIVSKGKVLRKRVADFVPPRLGYIDTSEIFHRREVIHYGLWEGGVYEVDYNFVKKLSQHIKIKPLKIPTVYYTI